MTLLIMMILSRYNEHEAKFAVIILQQIASERFCRIATTKSMIRTKLFLP